MTRGGRRPDVRALVARLSERAAALLGREILTPSLPGGKIRTRLDGLVYKLGHRGTFAGWGRFRPVSEREVELVGEASPWERDAYLELPRPLRVLLLWPDAGSGQPGTWWALPYNESDARQRFGFDGASPLAVFLCDPTDGADRFERVIARVDGRTLWYGGPDPLADPEQAQWLRDAASAGEPPETFAAGLAQEQRAALLLSQIHELELDGLAERLRLEGAGREGPRTQRERVDHLAARVRLERRLRHALAKADATLHGFQEVAGPDGSPGHLVVEWSERGRRHRYRAFLEPDLTVVSSGICLSGRDRDFDLTSLVSVTARGPAWPGEE